MTQEMDKLLNERRKLVDNLVDITMVIGKGGIRWENLCVVM